MKHQKSPGSATAEELQKMIENKKFIKHELEEVKEKVQNFEHTINTIESTLKHQQTFGRKSQAGGDSTLPSPKSSLLQNALTPEIKIEIQDSTPKPVQTTNRIESGPKNEVAQKQTPTIVHQNDGFVAQDNNQVQPKTNNDDEASDKKNE